MRYFNIGDTEYRASRVVQGCMRIGSMEPDALDRLLRTDLEGGINFFDHADIYGGGRCEEVFGYWLAANGGMRDRVIIQTKCGIRPGVCYDFSYRHIMDSVEGSLRRLRTDHIDFLLLHRPDTLMEPDEVGRAFDDLHTSGKVAYFGVSNQNPMQMTLLSSGLGENFIRVNQLQLSPTETGMIDSGINVNTASPLAVDRDGSVLEYCRLNHITIQPWSPFQYGFFEGSYIDDPKYEKLNLVLAELAEKYSTTKEGIVIAWMLRHPATMQPIVGSTNVDRMSAICSASDLILTHEEWYRVYLSAGHRLP